MDRRTDEVQYVLGNLLRVRQEVIAHPEWFEPDAVERIDEAIAPLRGAIREAKAA